MAAGRFDVPVVGASGLSEWEEAAVKADRKIAALLASYAARRAAPGGWESLGARSVEQCAEWLCSAGWTLVEPPSGNP